MDTSLFGNVKPLRAKRDYAGFTLREAMELVPAEIITTWQMSAPRREPREQFLANWEADFVIAPDRAYLAAPLLCVVVEAKRDDFERSQLSASLKWLLADNATKKRTRFKPCSESPATGKCGSSTN